MSDGIDHRPVRKLCSCNAVLCPPGDTAAAPDTELFGVILLNSPANTEVDFGEYVRLFQLYRGGGGAAEGDDAAAAPKDKKGSFISPYFICVDGAYAALKRYCATRDAKAAESAFTHINNNDGDDEDEDEDAQGKSTDVPDSSALAAMRLCDVLIGDMDSLSTAQLRRVAAVAGEATDVRASSPTRDAPSFHAAGEGSNDNDGDVDAPLYHKKVSTIPVPLLEVIRHRRDDAIRRRHDPANTAAASAAVDTPVVLPITCQMTTDFHKAVALLERLRRLEQGNTEDLTEEAQATYYQTHQASDEVEELATLCAAQVERACEEAACQANGDEQEAARCRHLITDVSPHPSSSSTLPVQTRVLANVAVFGAFGGRVDHEIGAMVTVIRFASIFHLMVVNAHNVLFACWPDGVTQLLMPPSWTQQTTLSKDPAVSSAAVLAVPPHMCGIVSFGVLREMETAGCLWNVVKGRANRYNGFAQTEELRFAFDGLVSVCNTVTSCLVTVDARPTTCDTSNPVWDPEAPSVNPPTVFMLGRPKSAKKPSS